MDSTELYIVEGDSAGGSAKSGRDRRFQAILPIKGKILNVEKARLDKILEHNEIKMIITALGAGLLNDFNLEKRRYGKVIIMTDADVDGSHIRTLLLTFFFRQMRPLLEAGCVYIAQPPLYRFSRKRKKKYVFSDREFQKTLIEFGLEDSCLKAKKQGLVLEEKSLKDLVYSLLTLYYQLNSLSKRGIDAKKFLTLRNSETGKFPSIRYIYEKQSGYFFSEEELNQFVENQSKKIGEEINLIPIEEEKDQENTMQIEEIHETNIIFRCTQAIEKLGLKFDSYALEGVEEYELWYDKNREHIRLQRLAEILESLKNIARKGLDVQRYKGLGEMNPDQLWSTTMDPETRTLFRVTLDDASEAERLFTTLMGNNVDPRREFIEKHALEVRNLDV